MLVPGEATRLRVLIGEDDTFDERPLYEAILEAARAAQLAGVTVLRGIAGFGRSAQRHGTYRGFQDDLPIVVEIIDNEAKINAWLPTLERLLRGGLVTLENVRILQGGAVPLARTDEPITRRT